PFSMALFGWLFVGWLFRPWLPANQIDSYIAGLIILAAAPCTAMVFVWSNLTNGEPNFTLTQVALNDTIMVFAFAPIVGLLLGLSSITVPWTTLFLSVVLYLVCRLLLEKKNSVIGVHGAVHLRALVCRLAARRSRYRGTRLTRSAVTVTRTASGPPRSPGPRFRLS